MPKTSENYRQRLRVEMATLSAEAERQSRFDHLHALNFGRTVARLEQTHPALRLRFQWLLLGAVLNMTLSAIYLQANLIQRILQFAK